MSDLYLLIGLSATFLSIAILGVSVATARTARRNSLRFLEAQVGQAALSTNLRERELERSVAERVLLPFLGRLSSTARRLTPLDIRRRIRNQLILAGSPSGWDVERIAALKLVGIGGAVLAIIFFRFTGAFTSPGKGLLLSGLLVYIGFFGVDAVLARKGRERQEAIRRALPDTMDLLTISVEAGLSFDAALVQVMQNVPGPLSEEIGRMLQEMRLGTPRIDAFRNLAERSDVGELRSFIVAMVQADAFGVSVAKVLRAQAKELRTKRRQRAEEKAMKVPVKMIFPLVVCLLPSLFVVVLGPGIIRIIEGIFTEGAL